MERTLLFFTTDDITKLTEISGGDGVLENTFDSLKNISENSELISEYENNQIFKYCYNQALIEKEQEGIAKGISQGVKQTARTMLSKNIDTKTISEFTGLTEEEINSLSSEK